MSDALAKLQATATPEVLTPQRTVETCLAQGVVKRIQVLTEELAALQLDSYRNTVDEDEDSDKPVRKMGQGHDPRVGEIEAELAELQETMRAHTGRITIAATISQGDWRRWADKHPAREEGRDEKGRPILSVIDLGVTAGFCNATALLDRLGDFVTEWNGEPLVKGQWEWLRERMPLGDQKEAARAVVAIYEADGVKAAPKSRNGSQPTPETSPPSDSPEPSGSPASDSSAGSPVSDTSTSTPTGT